MMRVIGLNIHEKTDCSYLDDEQYFISKIYTIYFIKNNSLYKIIIKDGNYFMFDDFNKFSTIYKEKINYYDLRILHFVPKKVLYIDNIDDIPDEYVNKVISIKNNIFEYCNYPCVSYNNPIININMSLFEKTRY